MNDLISRQAAIDAINEIIRMEHSLRPKIYVAKDAIKKLPSVQPTFDARDTQYNLPIGTDLISRQAAIDALKRAKYPNKDIRDKFDSGRNAGLTYAAVIVEGLPAVQPKKGKWIGKYPVASVCSECGYLIHNGNIKAFAYCPNCGAKMER
jgi:rubrerythrin